MQPIVNIVKPPSLIVGLSPRKEIAKVATFLLFPYLFGSFLLSSSMLCSPITTDIVFGLTICKTRDKKFTSLLVYKCATVAPFTWHFRMLSLHILLAWPVLQSGPGFGGRKIQCAAVITHWSAIKVPAQDP